MSAADDDPPPVSRWHRSPGRRVSARLPLLVVVLSGLAAGLVVSGNAADLKAARSENRELVAERDRLEGRVVELEADLAASRAAAHDGEVERDRTSFGDGAWKVGVDIQAGTYETAGGADCSWETRSATGDIIDDDQPHGPTTVVIETSAVTFSSTRCGRWSRVG